MVIYCSSNIFKNISNRSEGQRERDRGRDRGTGTSSLYIYISLSLGFLAHLGIFYLIVILPEINSWDKVPVPLSHPCPTLVPLTAPLACTIMFFVNNERLDIYTSCVKEVTVVYSNFYFYIDIKKHDRTCNVQSCYYF